MKRVLKNVIVIVFLSSCASGFKSIEDSISKADHSIQAIQQASPFSFFPAKGSISSNFGYRVDPHLKEKKLHKGLDIQAPIGTNVVSTSSGQVMYAGKQNGYGLIVEILHDNQITTRYAHLDKILVKQPQRVEQGQLIGLLGQSGNATGPHVHYEILLKGEQIDPYAYTTSKKVIYAQ